ncbi:ankyrin-3-like isoform X2 [Ylistrum balloti]|nr:ankyrin-3-like isoform X2 [Ylistrum balloti]
MTGTHEDFFSSVHVVATGQGHYTVYQPHVKYAESQTNNSGLPDQRSSVSSNYIAGEGTSSESISSFRHHISNLSVGKSLNRPTASEDRSFVTNSHNGDNESKSKGFTSLTDGKNKKVRGRIMNGKREDGSMCYCKSYHIHTFSKPDFCRTFDNSNVEFDVSLSRTRSDLIEANEKHLIICNTFWRPFLARSEFQDGDDPLDFTSLWHEEGSLKELLRDGIQNTVLRTAISDVTLMAVSIGPVQLLRSLIDLSLVRVDTLLEDGAGLLHHACVFRRTEIIQYLVREGVSPLLKDKQGNTADQYCFSNEVRRSLPTKYHTQTGRALSGGVSTGRGTGVWGLSPYNRVHLLQPSIQDKDVIFTMATTVGSLMELQKRLQMFEFNVNTECDNQGDFIIHVAVKGGLCQLPLLMLLVRIQQADVELCNSKGMTPLMIAAQAGDPILCEVLICVFGASPNKCNVNNGKSALHYAAQYNHVDTVSSLIRCGADFNREDHNGMRPDDIGMRGYGEDCLNIISVLRTQRCENLSRLTVEGKLRPQDLRESDLSVVNVDGFTLLMMAALYNRVDSMKVILDFDSSKIKSYIDAQYFQMTGVCKEGLQTGMTTLAIAAHCGHTVCVRMLLQRGATPVICDVEGYLPLHHAVLENMEEVVDAMLVPEYFPSTYSGLHQACLMSKTASLDRKLRDAWKLRQKKIVMTELMSCAMNGKAEELYCLLEDGDNINSQTGVGSYPLYLAAENGHLEVVRLLCERGADVRQRHVSAGSTALHIAARMGKLDVVQYLLKFTSTYSDLENRSQCGGHKIDVNAVNSDGKTPLQLAAENGYIRIVKLLLSQGATTALLNTNGVLFSLPEYAYGGVFNEIEYHRHKHTNEVMKLIRDKSKKRLQELRKIWMPRFDHNLRDRNGDTPLMVACKLGRTEVVNFLLTSAVYKQVNTDSDPGSDSDTDSGVLDTATVTSDNTRLEGYEDSFENKSSTLQRKNSESDSGETGKGHWGQRSGESSRPPSRVESLLSDVDKPKGLSIYHDGFVSHVCAVSLRDGSLPIHRCLEGGDHHTIVESLLQADTTCINTQNSAGLTPLHLACKLIRKKSLDKLLATDGIDINLLTLTGQLAEEITNNKTVIKLVQKARKGHPVRKRMSSSASLMSPASSVTDAAPYHKPPSTTGSTISLEKVHVRFEQLKHSHQLKQSREACKN